MNTQRNAYQTDLSDTEWQIAEPLIPAQQTRGRKLKYSRREILNAIFYLVRAGCTWRMLPHDLPPYRIVFHYYSLWRTDGTWQAVHQALYEASREAEGRNVQPSAAIIDSQSVKTTEHVKVDTVGYDAGKQVKGRKRHLLVDTLGLVMVVIVHSAGIQDRDGAKLVFDEAKTRFSRLKLVWADGIYNGSIGQWLSDKCGWLLEIVKRSDNLKGFKVLPHRWLVERTFGWLNRYRRLAKDYEYLPESSQTMVQVVMIRLMLKRLAAKRETQQRELARKQRRQALRTGYALAA